MATGLIIIAGILIFVYRDSFSSQSLKELTGLTDEEKEAAEPFTYESGSMQVFAPFGDGLAVASSSGINLFDSGGKNILSQIYSIQTPAIASSKKLCAFFDIGGTYLIVANSSGDFINLETEMPIISVTMNSSGYMAVVTEHTGYKALVIVYDTNVEPVYKYESGSRYILSAHVFPDNKGVALLCAGDEGSYISVYSFKDTDEQYSYSAPDELIIDMHISSGGSISAISQSRMIFLDKTLSEKGSFSFQNQYLADYQLGDNFSAVVLSRYRGGSDSRVITLSNTGDTLGEHDFAADIQCLRISDKELAILFPDSLNLYNSKLEEKDSLEESIASKKIIFTDSGKLMLLMSYGAEIIKF